MIATNNYNVLNIEPGLDYVYLLDDLEFAMTIEQLERVTKSWNEGMSLEQIAEEEKRHEVEVLMALIHQARKRKIKRSFAYRRGKGE